MLPAANSSVFLSLVQSTGAIGVKTPSGPSGHDCINQKLVSSKKLWALCDCKGRSFHTWVPGYPGSVRDTSVLKKSSMCKDALHPPPGYFIEGDGSYPCIDQPIAIITLFEEPLQGRVQSHLIQHHAKAHQSGPLV